MRIRNAATAHLVGIALRQAEALHLAIESQDTEAAELYAKELRHLARLNLDEGGTLATTVKAGLGRFGIPVAAIDLLDSKAQVTL